MSKPDPRKGHPHEWVVDSEGKGHWEVTMEDGTVLNAGGIALTEPPVDGGAPDETALENVCVLF